MVHLQTQRHRHRVRVRHSTWTVQISEHGLTALPLLSVISVFALCLAAGPASGQDYTYTTVYQPGAVYTVLTGINNANTAVGYYAIPDQSGYTVTIHGLVYRNGLLTTLDGPLPYQPTKAVAINNAGQIVVSQGNQYFLYNEGNYAPIGLSGQTPTTVFDVSSINGINDNGQIVGKADDGNGVFGLPSIGQPGTTTPPISFGNYKEFSCPNQQGVTTATGINNLTQITGLCGTSGYIYSSGTFSPFQYAAPGCSTYSFGTFSYGIGINSSGVVAGACQTPGAVGSLNVPFIGFTYDGTHFRQVLPPYSSGSVANGVNDQGVVVGYSYCPGSTSTQCGFITIPSGSQPPPVCSITSGTAVHVLGIPDSRTAIGIGEVVKLSASKSMRWDIQSGGGWLTQTAVDGSCIAPTAPLSSYAATGKSVCFDAAYSTSHTVITASDVAASCSKSLDIVQPSGLIFQMLHESPLPQPYYQYWPFLDIVTDIGMWSAVFVTPGNVSFANIGFYEHDRGDALYKGIAKYQPEIFETFTDDRGKSTQASLLACDMDKDVVLFYDGLAIPNPGDYLSYTHSSVQSQWYYTYLGNSVGKPFSTVTTRISRPYLLKYRYEKVQTQALTDSGSFVDTPDALGAVLELSYDAKHSAYLPQLGRTNQEGIDNCKIAVQKQLAK